MRIWARYAFLATAGLLLAACASHNRIPPPSTDIDETAYRDHMRVLASDDFEGRKPGTSGEEKTVAYLVAQFRRLGLKPGNGESFLQPVPLVEITLGPDTSLSIHGNKGDAKLAYGRDAVIWTPRAVPQVRLEHSELVFVGFGIVAPEYSWNDYADIDVRGKTVVVLLGDPGYATKDPKVFKGNAMTYYGRAAYKVEEASRQGAGGVLLIHDADAAGYAWSVVQNTRMGPQLQRASADGNAALPAIEGWLQNEVGRALFAQGGLAFAAESAAAAHPGFKAHSFGLSVDATLHGSVRQFSSSNVIALLPGNARRKEYVVYAAHWDSLGRDPSLAGHNVFNGAVDNATGTAGLLALAQSFVRTKPVADRSIVFLAVTCGECGLLGSAYYADNPVFPLRQTAAVIDLDMLHTGGPTRDVSVFGFGNSDLEDTARSEALLQGREMRAEPAPERGYYYRSDSFSFARHGVPALYVKGGIDDTARGPVWGQEQIDDYTSRRYRQPSDQYSPLWDVRGTLDDLTLYYQVGNRLARSRRFPRWYPNSEFRVTRDRSREP